MWFNNSENLHLTWRKDEPNQKPKNTQHEKKSEKTSAILFCRIFYAMIEWIIDKFPMSSFLN